MTLTKSGLANMFCDTLGLTKRESKRVVETFYEEITLERSGEYFPVDNLVELACWGHFEKADYPWARTRPV